MSPSAHVRVWDGADPPIEQWEAGSESMVQSTPVSEGSGSLTVTPVAVPGPPFPTVTVKPIDVPEPTGVASAVLVIARLGPLTTMVAKSWTDPPLVDEAVAVLGSEPDVAPVVRLVM